MVDDVRRTDGRRLGGYTISSHCEPNGSGELKSFNIHKSNDSSYLIYCVIAHFLISKRSNTKTANAFITMATISSSQVKSHVNLAESFSVHNVCQRFA